MSQSFPEITPGSLQGFPTLCLRTRCMELVLVPSLGGRLVSLCNRRSGREWLWHRPGARWLWESAPGSSFGDGPQAGLDECLPTVAACRVAGRELPDHGDLWVREWHTDPAALEEGEIRHSLALDSLPLRFTRTLRAVDEQTLEFDYQLENLSGETLPFLWCQHPLFTLGIGDRLELPSGVSSLRLNGGLGVPIVHGDTWHWPEPFPGIRLDRLECPGGEGACVKGFALGVSEGRAALVSGGAGDRLEMSWDAAALPVLGLWLNRGHGGFHHVALEPSNGAPDSLADAVHAWKCHPTLDAWGRRSWRVRWTLTSPV